MTLVGIVAPTRATAQTASEPAAAEPASYPTERIAPPARQIYPIIGARWFLPTDTAIRDLYGSGPGLGIGVGVHVRRRLAIEAQLEWYRSTAHPIGPAFVNGSESTLTLLPVSTMLRYRFSEGPAAVLFSIGPALLFQLESFDYRLLGETGSASDTQTGFGLSIGLGWETARGPLTYRVLGRAVVGSTTRTILRDEAPGIDTDETAAPSLVGVGLEVRLP